MPKAIVPPNERVTLRVVPREYAKLLYHQQSKKGTGPSTQSLSDLAHEMWLAPLPDPPADFRILNKRGRRIWPINGAEPAVLTHKPVKRARGAA